MSVGLKVGFMWYQIGRPDYLDSFFCTISYYLEDSKWGSKYPVLMKELYQGELESNKCGLAIDELNNIKKNLSEYPTNAYPIKWNPRDLSEETPEWAITPNADKVTLSNYYITQDGRDMIGIFINALERSLSTGTSVLLTSLGKDSLSI